MKKSSSPSLMLSLVPVVFLVVLLIVNVKIFGDNATGGANQLALFLSGLVCVLLAKFLQKMEYPALEKEAIRSINLSLQANLILLTVGTLIGVWILAGIVPSMIYYGILLMSPTYFLASACLICCLVSLATGSSWSTGGTMGVALIGIGQTLGIPVEMVAGAVISGSYFGDKLSPLSDTTNLAPAMAGAELFAHIKYMLFTTLPAICTALVIFFFLGLQFSGGEVQQDQIQSVLSALREQFTITPWLFLAPLLVLVLVYFKMSALPAMFLGILAGVFLALVFQGGKSLDSSGGLAAIYQQIITASTDGYVSKSGNSFIDDLLSRGGMSSMLSTVWLIITAMFFGGMMEACGYLQKIASALLQLVSGVSSLVAATLSSCIFLNITASDQYLSIVVAGRMFRNAFEEYGLAPVNLSRSLEDGGTVTSVLVPWNSGGAYFSSVLGVATLSYLPFCFFNLLSPIFSALIAMIGFNILKSPQKSGKAS